MLIACMTRGLLGLTVLGGSGGGGSSHVEEEVKYGKWEALTTILTPTTSCTNTAADCVDINTLEDTAVVAPGVEVVVGDWDEIPPPRDTKATNISTTTTTNTTSITTKRRPSSGSALHRKYSNIQHTSTTNTDNDVYFQKFVMAAAEGSTNPYMNNTNSSVGAYSGTGGTSGGTSSASISNMMAVGSAVSSTTMENVDQLCTGFGRMLHLQR